MKRVKFSIEEAKEIGFDEIEKKALKMLKEGFTGDWRKAEVTATVDGDQLVFVLEEYE